MSSIEIRYLLLVLFWLSALLIAYTYVLYPLLLGVLGRMGKPWQREFVPTKAPVVTVILAARNEGDRIGIRVREILEHLDQCELEAEVIVISDGSTDHTVAQVQGIADTRVTLHELQENRGKAHAISVGATLATGEILIFCDCRQRWESGALRELLANFADPQVGAASGDLVLESGSGALEGVGLYWRLEKWMRLQEAQWHSCVGVTGAMCAVRRHLFRAIPQGMILDDVYWPLQVALQGYRVVHDTRARSFDRLPPKKGDEFQRKIRTLSGNFQLLCRLPSVLRLWNNPILFPFVSHKLMRLAAPWALLCLLVSSALLGGAIFTTLFVLQVVAYAIACIGLSIPRACRVRVVSFASAFLLLNTACWLSFFVWLSGAAATSLEASSL